MFSPSFREILPLTAEVNKQGHLSIGGCDISDLVGRFSTPLYVYDESTIRHMCNAFLNGFRAEYAQTNVAYSSKAFANPALSRILDQEGLSMDVVSGGELAQARHTGFPPERLNFHGNNKSKVELVEALGYGIGRVTIDSFYEIEQLNEIAGELGRKQSVLLRVSPSIDPHTHMLTTTGVLDSKFGFPIEIGHAEEAVKRAQAAPHLDVTGLHFHLGSPIFDLEPYSSAVRYVLEFAARMRVHDFVLREFSPGGGFAIGYVPDGQPPSVREYATEICAAVIAGCDALGLDEPALIVEPGRAIVGRAGVAVYSVGAIKEVPGVRNFVSVDGGMGDNIRPALYGAKYSVVSVNSPLSPHNYEATIAGKYCESGDLLVQGAGIPVPRPGDLLAMPASGAYCIPMASNYNMATKPAVLMVAKGKARLIRRRETYDDLLATSVL